ncbi:hypothetical protein VTO73DRAFT_13341 [Trametes versicolor]
MSQSSSRIALSSIPHVPPSPTNVPASKKQKTVTVQGGKKLFKMPASFAGAASTADRTTSGGATPHRRLVDMVMQLRTNVQKLEGTVQGMDTAMKRLLFDNAEMLTRLAKRPKGSA